MRHSGAHTVRHPRVPGFLFTGVPEEFLRGPGAHEPSESPEPPEAPELSEASKPSKLPCVRSSEHPDPVELPFFSSMSFQPRDCVRSLATIGHSAGTAALVSGVVDPRVVAAILGGHDLIDESDDRFGYFALALLRRHHMRERWRVTGSVNICL